MTFNLKCARMRVCVRLNVCECMCENCCMFHYEMSIFNPLRPLVSSTRAHISIFLLWLPFVHTHNHKIIPPNAIHFNHEKLMQLICERVLIYFINNVRNVLLVSYYFEKLVPYARMCVVFQVIFIYLKL